MSCFLQIKQKVDQAFDVLKGSVKIRNSVTSETDSISSDITTGIVMTFSFIKGTKPTFTYESAMADGKRWEVGK